MSAKDYQKDYYKALGVPKTATPAEIKKSYRELARKWHPDANKGSADAEERFKEITEAYNVLSDEKQRKEYDEARSMFGGFRVPTGARPGQGGTPFDLGDLFGGGSDGLGDVLGGIFRNRGGGTASSRAARRGADVETETTLAFGDAIDGATVSLRLTGEGPCPVCGGTGAKSGTVPKVCPDCHGTGQQSRNLGGFGLSEPCKTCRGRGLVVEDPCPACSGSGRAMSSRTIQARIPAGVADGQRIKLAGKGAPGEHGGKAGDLYVRVHVKANDVFGRSGDNLTVTVPVTITELALGADIKVPTHRGPAVTVRVKPGSANGTVIRVPGRGVRRKDGTMGDLRATLEVTVPQDLSKKAKSALEDLRIATEGADPREELLRKARQGD
jgi:molecular chaperone DnaJ